VVLVGWFEANLSDVFSKQNFKLFTVCTVVYVGSTQHAESAGLLYNNHGIELDAS
jgi:hypothetical protein